MLIRGQTTEDRIREIANSFAQGLDSYSEAQRRQNQFLQEENRYNDAKEREKEARKRQEAIQQYEIEAKISEQTGKNVLGTGLGAKILKGESLSPEMIEPLPLTRKAFLDAEDRKLKAEDRELDKRFKESQINKNYASSKKAASGGTDKVIQKQMEKLGTDNAQLYKVSSAMKEAIGQLKNPNLTESDKIKAGQGLLKLLNSAEGSDAVGAEEAQRLGSYLEFQVGNLTNPGPMFGRDIGGFTKQVENYSQLLDGRIQRGQQGIDALRQGKTLDQISETPVAPTVTAPPQRITDKVAAPQFTDPAQKARYERYLQLKAATGGA